MFARLQTTTCTCSLLRSGPQISYPLVARAFAAVQLVAVILAVIGSSITEVKKDDCSETAKESVNPFARLPTLWMAALVRVVSKNSSMHMQYVRCVH